MSVQNTQTDVICNTEGCALVIRIDERLGGLSQDMHDIKYLLSAQNGRVRDLEHWRWKTAGGLVAAVLLTGWGLTLFKLLS